MIQDPILQTAVSRILQRAERQTDPGKLIETYVDVGLLRQLHNANHQIFFGRRGTGKTHVMKVLESKFAEDPNLTVVFLDCRTLGSTSQFSDKSLTMNSRCLALFRDFLLTIHNELLQHIVYSPSEQAEKALEAVDSLLVTVREPITTFTASSMESEISATTESARHLSASLDASIQLQSAEIHAGLAQRSGRGERKNTQYSIESEDKIIFPELLRDLRDVLRLAKTELVVLVDEWSSLPQDVQPYFAEFLKRGLLPEWHLLKG